MSQADFFVQPVAVYIDKTNQVIGNYALGIRDIDNGNHVENLYSDSPNSPRNVVIYGTIGAHNEDRVDACVMKMDTQEMACDEQTAYYGQSIVFTIDMNKAVLVPQQNNDGNQQGGGEFDQFNPNPSINAPNANSNNNNTFSGGSNFTPTSMTRVSFDQSMAAPPVAANMTHAVGPKVQHLVTSTEEGSLNLVFDIGVGRPTTVTFLDPTNNKTVSSVDYDIVVKPANSTEIVYKASENAGQANKPLRAENGFVTIPTESFQPGTYEVKVYVYSINGSPLKIVDQGEAFIYHQVIS